MSSVYIFNFDGTGNEPKDANQNNNKKIVEDDNISNILKFHLLCGGSLKKSMRGSSWDRAKQQCYYYAGIGTYGNKLQRIINSVLSPEGSDVGKILKRALHDFDVICSAGLKSDDIIIITGFSRGAALARRFAALICDRLPSSSPSIYEAVFDTVAAIQKPNNPLRSKRPKSTVLFENQSLPNKVTGALHLVSLDETRRFFQPTLMNHEAKVLEIWFPGAHSDVGGGYYYDGLSDNALRFFLRWIEETVPNLIIRSAKEINYPNILPKKAAFMITEDDMVINSNPLGMCHMKERPWIIKKLTLKARRCCVVKNDQPCEIQPIVHWSVATRINKDEDYRPKSLRGVQHDIFYPDRTTARCHGVKDHIKLSQSNLKVLHVNDMVEVSVDASEIYNHTGIYLFEGGKYQFSVLGEQYWHDGNHQCGATGRQRENEKLGGSSATYDDVVPLKRVTNASWFSMCGAISDNENELFYIGAINTYEPQRTGEFCPFANDILSYYGDNRGVLKLQVLRLE